MIKYTFVYVNLVNDPIWIINIVVQIFLSPIIYLVFKLTGSTRILSKEYLLKIYFKFLSKKKKGVVSCVLLSVIFYSSVL